MRSKEQHAKSNLKCYHQRRRKLIEQLGGKCTRCGSTENLEFDHIDSDSKEINISGRITYSINLIQAELSKCQLLCHSCHIQKTKEAKDAGAKITQSDARNIRQEYASSDITQAKLGEKYGLKQPEIGNILRGERWLQQNENPSIQEQIDIKRSKTNSIPPNRSIPVDQIDIASGKIIATYSSLSDAAKRGFQTHHIAECCRGVVKQHKGYKWQFHKNIT